MQQHPHSIWHKIALFGLLSSPLLGALWPEDLLPMVATRQLPALVHLITIGIFIPLFLLRLNNQPLGWTKITPWIPRILILGLAGFLAGFLLPNRWSLYLGGHYALPSAIYLVSLQSAIGAWKNRKQGGLQGLGWPVFGLFILANLGGMLILDRFYGGKYGFYSPNTVVAHALGAFFLFVLPVLYIRTQQGRYIRSYFALGLLCFGLYLYGWLLNAPQIYTYSGLSAAILFAWLSKGFHWDQISSKLLKTGWLLVATITVLSSFNLGLQLDQAATLLSITLFVIYGLIVPYLASTNNLLHERRNQDFFQFAAILLGICFAIGSQSSIPLWPIFGVYFLLCVTWVLPLSYKGRPAS